MIRWQARAARLTLHLSGLVLPERGGDWLRAMEHEFAYIPQPQRLSFALGCLFTTLIERVRFMTRMPPLPIVPGLIAAAALCFGCAVTGATLLHAAPAAGGLLMFVSALWAVMFFAVQDQNAALVWRLGFFGVFLYAALGIANYAGLPALESAPRLNRALAIEGVVQFGAAMIAASIPWFWRKPDAA